MIADVTSRKLSQLIAQAFHLMWKDIPPKYTDECVDYSVQLYIPNQLTS